MKVYNMEDVRVSQFVFSQWFVYVRSMKLKVIGYEKFIIEDNGQAKIMAETNEGKIKMAVPPTEWELN